MIFGKGYFYERYKFMSYDNKFSIFAGFIPDVSFYNVKTALTEKNSLLEFLKTINVDRKIILLSANEINIDPNSEFSIHKKNIESKFRNYCLQNKLIFYILRLPDIYDLNKSSASLIDKIFKSNSQLSFLKDQKKVLNFLSMDDVFDLSIKVINNKNFRNRITSLNNFYSVYYENLFLAINSFNKNNLIKTKIPLISTEYKTSINGKIFSKNEMNADEKYYLKMIESYFLGVNKKKLSIIIPTYNQDSGIHFLLERLEKVLNYLSTNFDYEIIFVNDASEDTTLDKLKQIAKKDKKIKIISFSRNFGNQSAIQAGLMHSSGDATIIIDDDLQDPPEIIIEFINKWREGFKVVYGIRPKRKGVSLLFKFISNLFYKLIYFLSDYSIPKNTGDFRLIDKDVVDQLKNLKERNLYFRGLISWVGFKQIGITYERDKRFAGKSSFTLKKYINFALNGITAISDGPLVFVCLLGFFITILSFIFLFSLIIYKLLTPNFIIQGWTSLAVFVFFFGGLQILSMGIIGIYLAKVLKDVRERPNYIIEDKINF